MPAGPWVVLCRCGQHVHAQDARPGFQFFIVRLITWQDIPLHYPIGSRCARGFRVQMWDVAVAVSVPRLNVHADHALRARRVVRIAYLFQQRGIVVYNPASAPDL